MGKFPENEKPVQTKFKYEAPYLNPSARKDGIYRGKSRPFCLPRENTEENLFHKFRQQAIHYFEEQGIKWHDGRDGQPSNRLCASQVYCVNFLFAFADQPEVTSPALRETGKSATGKWKELVKLSDRFGSVITEGLFGNFPVERYPMMRKWWEYLTARYRWLV